MDDQSPSPAAFPLGHSPRGKKIMAEQDSSAMSPSKRKNSQEEGLQEAKHLRISPTPLEDILIDEYFQCLSERKHTCETLFSFASFRQRTPLRERKAEETRTAQENMRKELLDGILDCIKKNAEDRETKDKLEKAVEKHLELERKIKSLTEDLVEQLRRKHHTEETEVQEGGSSCPQNLAELVIMW